MSKQEFIDVAEQYFEERDMEPTKIYVFDDETDPVGMVAHFHNIEWVNRLDNDGAVRMDESAMGIIDDQISLHFGIEW